MSSSLESLHYIRGSLEVIDQLKLPHECTYIPVKSSEDAWDVIKKMQVRGAPLIAIVAALGLAVDVIARKVSLGSAADAQAFLLEKMEYLRTSRPTAVNLFVATDELKGVVEGLTASNGATGASVVDGYVAHAEEMLKIDVATNMAIGDHGAQKILALTGKRKVKVVTICNTGSLATAGYGTALGVIRSLAKMGALEHVYACETRPYNQGARLTAFECVADGLPASLITDSMAAYLMSVKDVDCVVVGADRVAANGDTANKIGTYMLAISAKYHGIPFFPAVPTTTLDLSMSSGVTIPVELRPAVELTSIFGQKIAPDGIGAWNPAFDVTPCSLITGIITEVGVAVAAADGGSDGVIDMPAFLAQNGLEKLVKDAAKPSAAPTGYVAFTDKNIAAYVVQHSRVAQQLGTSDAAAVAVEEVGDGNLNFVYILRGPSGIVVAKQALPYIRCVGESWPLSLDRATFEHNALRVQFGLCPSMVPDIYHFESRKALIVMEFVPPPNLILRKHFMAGTRLPLMAGDVGRFCAETLFGTSALKLEGGTLRSNIAEWSKNTALCALTEQVVFTDPYYSAPMNHHTSPQLDDFAASIRGDNKLKAAAAVMKGRFLTCAEALVHGDLHTGSVMAAADSTYIIDPEFAFYGPMGFDVGAFLANLLLAYFSMPGHAAPDADYPAWLLQQLRTFYATFESSFLRLWTEAPAPGEQFRAGPFPDPASLAASQATYMARLFRDTVGFAGMKMIRRIVGIAHVADMDEIADADARASCEKRAVLLARQMVLFGAGADAAAIAGIDDLSARAQMVFAQTDLAYPATA